MLYQERKSTAKEPRSTVQANNHNSTTINIINYRHATKTKK
jgi:hypothetical protein